MCYDWSWLMCLGLNSPLTFQFLHVCQSAVSGILMSRMAMQIRSEQRAELACCVGKGTKALFLSIGRTGFTHRLWPAPYLLLTVTMALHPVLSASYWKESVSKLFLLFLSLIKHVRWSGITTGFRANPSWQGFETKHKSWRFWSRLFASFRDKILPYHEYLLVPLLCSGEADDFSGFSLLSCFHGLLDRSTREDAKVRADLMRRVKTEAPVQREKSATSVLVCVIHLRGIWLWAGK